MTAEITRHHKNKLREGPSTNIGWEFGDLHVKHYTFVPIDLYTQQHALSIFVNPQIFSIIYQKQNEEVLFHWPCKIIFSKRKITVKFVKGLTSACSVQEDCARQVFVHKKNSISPSSCA
jgi:hypothetical protein